MEVMVRRIREDCERGGEKVSVKGTLSEISEAGMVWVQMGRSVFDSAKENIISPVRGGRRKVQGVTVMLYTVSVGMISICRGVRSRGGKGSEEDRNDV